MVEKTDTARVEAALNKIHPAASVPVGSPRLRSDGSVYGRCPGPVRGQLRMSQQLEHRHFETEGQPASPLLFVQVENAEATPGKRQSSREAAPGTQHARQRDLKITPVESEGVVQYTANGSVGQALDARRHLRAVHYPVQEHKATIGQDQVSPGDYLAALEPAGPLAVFPDNALRFTGWRVIHATPTPSHSAMLAANLATFPRTIRARRTPGPA